VFCKNFFKAMQVTFSLGQCESCQKYVFLLASKCEVGRLPIKIGKGRKSREHGKSLDKAVADLVLVRCLIVWRNLGRLYKLRETRPNTEYKNGHAMTGRGNYS
jgi:hypothetical protein